MKNIIFFSFKTDTFSFFEHEIRMKIVKTKNILFKNLIIRLLTDKFKSLSVYADDFKGLFIKNECGRFY